MNTNGNIVESSHNEEIKEIINAIPNWLTSWGISIVVGVLIIAIFIIANIPNYQSTIVKVWIRSEKDIPRVKSLNSFTVRKVLVKENDNVLFKEPFLITVNEVTNKIDTITVPISGKVHFLTYITKNATINKGAELFSIVPSNNTIYGEAELSKEQLSSCRVGDIITISELNFKINKKGKIIFIAPYPLTNSKFKVRIQFESQAGNNIPLPLECSGEIMGKKETILRRFFKSF